MVGLNHVYPFNQHSWLKGLGQKIGPQIVGGSK
jgi:hypothetical protein